MDSSIGVGRYSIGLDALVGLIPGLGDVLTTMVSVLIVGRALQNGVHRSAILRMLLNLGIDTAVGSVPVIGAGAVGSRAERIGSGGDDNDRAAGPTSCAVTVVRVSATAAARSTGDRARCSASRFSATKRATSFDVGDAQHSTGERSARIRRISDTRHRLDHTKCRRTV